MNRAAIFAAFLSLVGIASAGLSDEKGEGPPNWLADVVKKARADHPRLENRQQKQIIGEISKDARGVKLTASDKLIRAVKEGLARANEVQKEFDKKPNLAAPSPAMEASWVIFKVCEVEIPKNEKGP